MEMNGRLPEDQKEIYTRAMSALDDARVPYVLSGAFASYYYTGAWRNTKDLDLFLTPEFRDAALDALAKVGFRTEITVSYWLAKAFDQDIQVDLITGLGNALAPVDNDWVDFAESVQILGRSTRIIAAEDLIWAKSYVAGRERFDGADIAHLIYRASDKIDWQRLINHYGRHWELLAVYLHLYRFIYPEARENVPHWVMQQLHDRMYADFKCPEEPDLPFRGPLLDRYSYLVDINEWGLPDPRETVAEARGESVEDVVSEREADQQRFEEYQPTPS